MECRFAEREGFRSEMVERWQAGERRVLLVERRNLHRMALGPKSVSRGSRCSTRPLKDGECPPSEMGDAM